MLRSDSDDPAVREQERGFALTCCNLNEMARMRFEMEVLDQKRRLEDQRRAYEQQHREQEQAFRHEQWVRTL